MKSEMFCFDKAVGAGVGLGWSQWLNGSQSDEAKYAKLL